MTDLAQSKFALPSWSFTWLVCPRCRGKVVPAGDELRCGSCGTVGRLQSGIVCFGTFANDPSILWYETVGGTHFHERMQLPYTMSSLDAPVYWDYLEKLKPDSVDKVIIDVGAGDGRNTEPWLRWGYRHVIATDANFSSLARLQSRLRAEHPEFLEHLLLIECDVRQIPIASAEAALVLAIEVLCYLNEDYELGLVECRRLLSETGLILISDRSWEGALFTRLLYGGVKEMLAMSDSRDFRDGYGANLVRSRTFTEDELLALIEKTQLIPLERKGLSLLPLIFGYLRQQNRLSAEDSQYLPHLRCVLERLGNIGNMRRTHVIVAGNRSHDNVR